MTGAIDTLRLTAEDALGLLERKEVSGAELLGELLDLFVRQRQPREPRDVQYFVSGYRHRNRSSQRDGPPVGSPSAYVM